MHIIQLCAANDRQFFTLQARQALSRFRDVQYCWFSSATRPRLEAPGAKTMKHQLLLLEGEHQEPVGDGHRGPPASNANSRSAGLLEGSHRRGRRQGEGARGPESTRTSQTQHPAAPGAHSQGCEDPCSGGGGALTDEGFLFAKRSLNIFCSPSDLNLNAAV